MQYFTVCAVDGLGKENDVLIMCVFDRNGGCEEWFINDYLDLSCISPDELTLCYADVVHEDIHIDY